MIAIAGFRRWLGPCERLIYRLAGPQCVGSMSWQKYAAAVLVFNFVGFIALYALLRLQDHLPLNPQHFPAVPPDLAINTAVSFATNTNWQGYGGESTMSYLTQMLGLARAELRFGRGRHGGVGGHDSRLSRPPDGREAGGCDRSIRTANG